MDITRLRDELKAILINKFNGKSNGRGNIIAIQCKYCNDKHKHLGVALPTDTELPWFNCVRCGASGILTHNKLVEWGVDSDPNLLIDIAKHNKEVSKNPINFKYMDREVYILSNSNISDCNLSRSKLNYINKRLGLQLNYKDLLENKIVLNLYDLLDSNGINKYTRDIDIMNELNSSFIGFISTDNAYLNMRNLRKGKLKNKIIDTRYINYNIFGKFDNTERHFTLPVGVDILDPTPIKIRIAEGPLDILSVRYNLVNNEPSVGQNIYCSILGSSYYQMVRYFFVTLGLINVEFHIYIDTDINIGYFNDLNMALEPYDAPLYIHSNAMKGTDIFGKQIKDFGVDKSRIKEQIVRLG